MLKNMLLRRWIISRSPNHCESAGSFRSLNSACAGRRDSPTISHKPFGSPPWPMLPPVLDGGAAEIVGCSHGWVAVFNKFSNDLFLTDPLSHRKISLPPVHTLPDPSFNLDLDGYAAVSKVILSSSPDAGDEDCRAMMTFGPGNRLAFCLPGRSSEWTPLGHPFFDIDLDLPFDSVARVHEDVVYCTRRKLFTSLTSCHFGFDPSLGLESLEDSPHPQRYDWNIADPNSPRIVGSEFLFSHYYRAPDLWFDVNSELLEGECVQIPHLVYAEESDKLFVAMQFVRLMDPDSDTPLGYMPSCELRGLRGVFPGKTFGFVVMEMDEKDLREGGKKRYMNDERMCEVVVEDDLNGMSMFVGINHSFAVSISERDQLFKPNCIYFSDAKRLRTVVSCAGDTGVFDYATKTISPLNHHHHPLPSSPFWLS